MIYVHTIWNHDEDDIGVFFYYELNEQGIIKRQVEIYKDFSFGLACDSFQYNTFISNEKISLDDIHNSILFDNESTTLFISEMQFNAVWDFFMQQINPTGRSSS